MRILIIDDEPLVRRSLKRAFISAGHEVLDVAEGDSGLKAWKSYQPDIAFVDVLMPGLTGPQLLESLSDDDRKKTKIFLMSAFTGQEGIKKNFDLFISKPFEDIFSLVKLAEEFVKND